MALLTLVPLWRCVIAGETIGAWDEVRTMAPWNQAADASPWDVLQADSVLQFYGWRDQVFKAWAGGHIPQWNHRELMGTPLLANSQSGALYPPHVLLGLLHAPTGPSMALLAWLHLFLAAFGVYTLCRGLGGGRLPALLAGAVFGLSPFMLAWATLPSVIETVAWIPWLLVGLYQLPTRRGILILALSTALLLLAGHLQFAVYGFVAVALCLIGRVIQEKNFRLRVAVLGVCAMATGGLLAAPQILPVLKFGQHSHRRVEPTSEGFAAYSAGGLPIWEVLSMPDANLLGSGSSTLTVKGTELTGFWPALVQRGGTFAESAFAIGPVALWLLILGLRKRKANWGVASFGVIGILLALGTFVGAALYFVVPGWSATGSPGRAGVLALLAGCVLAGLWNPELELPEARQVKRGSLLFAGITIVCIGLLARIPMQPWATAISAEDLQSAIPWAVLGGKALVTALVVAALGYVMVSLPKWAPHAAAGLLAVVVASSASTPIRSSAHIIAPAENPSLERYAFVNKGWDLLIAPKAVMPPNTAGLMGLHDVGGYDSIVDKSTRDQLADIDGDDPAPAANGNMMFVKPNFDLAKLADAGVTHVFSLQLLPQFSSAPAPTDGVFEYPLPGPGRVSISSGSATLTHENADSLEIEASGPGTLTVRDHLQEGWECLIDDQHADVASGSWPTVSVPKGRHTIRFQYEAPGLATGFRLALLGFVVLAVYGALTLRKTSTALPPVVQ